MSSEQAVIDDLEGKLAAASATEIELATEAHRISYSALSDGDDGAKKALAKIDADEVKLRQQQKHLRDALEEAKRRLLECQRANERERLAGNAERGREIGASFAARQRRIDAALAIVGEESRGSLAEINELHLLCLASPRAEQYKVLGESAISSALMDTPVKLRHLAPRERRTFTEIGDGWRLQIENWAAPFLEKANAEAAE
jgi:hypothetical protein